MKRFILALLPLILYGNSLSAEVDLETHVQSFVLETKKISVPQYPHAFNPSIVRWKGLLILSFRVLINPNDSELIVTKSFGSPESEIGMILIDESFNCIGEAQILDFSHDGIRRAEDARLITVGESLYLIYSDNRLPEFQEGMFRMYVSELDYDGSNFTLLSTECLSHYEWEDPQRREKNWVPFDYYSNLLLAYSLAPHRILFPLLETGLCEKIAVTLGKISWKWGDLRGGTPALLIDHERYLGFFHSSRDMASVHSEGNVMPHYFMGAYTFHRHPPFEITSMSKEPIVGKGFYHGDEYDYYWKPVRVVFPCGFIVDRSFIWVTYGRQDHEIWVVKLEKHGLLNSLAPVSTIFPPIIR